MIVRRARPDDRQLLFDIWDRAVRATHDFLGEGDRRHIAALVRNSYLPNAHLWIAVEDDVPVGFMGMNGNEIESLFVDPAAHGRGIGRALVDHARTLTRPLRVDVNEQNPGAIGFYRHVGFHEVGRSPVDSGGRPYPLIHMADD